MKKKTLKFVGYKVSSDLTSNPDVFWDLLFDKVSKKMQLQKKVVKHYRDTNFIALPQGGKQT